MIFIRLSVSESGKKFCSDCEHDFEESHFENSEAASNVIDDKIANAILYNAKLKKQLQEHCIYLEDSGVSLFGGQFNVWGSPWQNGYLDFSFALPDEFRFLKDTLGRSYVHEKSSANKETEDLPKQNSERATSSTEDGQSDTILDDQSTIPDSISPQDLDDSSLGTPQLNLQQNVNENGQNVNESVVQNKNVKQNKVLQNESICARKVSS